MSEAMGPAGLPLAEYRDHRDQVGDEQLLWENNGWSVRGHAGGRDFLLWVSPYFLKGYPGGAFRLDTASLSQTMIVFADDLSQPLSMPNDFWSAGWAPHEFGAWDAWKVDVDDAAVRWTDGSRTFITEPAGWRVTGAHADVDLDLRLAPERDAMWLSPPDEPLTARQDRWWIANATATGTITVEGEPLAVEGHALHERHIHLGTRYNPVELLRGGGVTWHSGSAPGLRYSVLARPSLDKCWAILDVDGQLLEVRDPAQVSVRAEEHWVDPETSLHLPRAWSMRVETPEASLELRTTAHARAYYLWNFLRDGVTVLYWWVCTSAGRVTGPGGTRELHDIRSEVHLNKTIYEVLPGAKQVARR